MLPRNAPEPGVFPLPKVALIVEDNRLNRRLFTEILRLEGLDIVTANDGAAAMACLDVRIPDIIMLDMQLPGMSGLTVIRAIRREPKLARIPVVAVSAFTLRRDQTAALAAGCDAYLRKPVIPQDMMDTVRALLRGPGGGLP